MVTWIDGNAPYHDRFVNKRQQQAAYSPPADAELIASITKIHESRCGGCHKAAEVSRADWIDIHRPERSLFLAAPLAESAGGTAKCREAPYRDREDEDYRAVLSLVEDAVEKAWNYPRRDLIALKDK